MTGLRPEFRLTCTVQSIAQSAAVAYPSLPMQRAVKGVSDLYSQIALNNSADAEYAANVVNVSMCNTAVHYMDAVPA